MAKPRFEFDLLPVKRPLIESQKMTMSWMRWT